MLLSVRCTVLNCVEAAQLIICHTVAVAVIVIVALRVTLFLNWILQFITKGNCVCLAHRVLIGAAMQVPGWPAQAAGCLSGLVSLKFQSRLRCVCRGEASANFSGKLE